MECATVLYSFCLVFNEPSQVRQFETISVYLPNIKRYGPDDKGQYSENKNSKSSSCQQAILQFSAHCFNLIFIKRHKT